MSEGRRVIFYLLVLFIVVPFVELALLLYLAELTDWRITLIIVVITGVIGSMLARAEGVRTLRKIQNQLATGQMPGQPLVDAFMILVAGALLVTPGILTDAFGLSLLIPPCRAVYRRWLTRRFAKSFTTQIQFRTSEPGSVADDDVIDSYVVETERNDAHDKDWDRE